jgi:hypothetical protein
MLCASGKAQRVELVEEEDSAMLLNRVEHQTQFGGSFPKELREERIEANDEERKAKVVS